MRRVAILLAATMALSAFVFAGPASAAKVKSCKSDKKLAANIQTAFNQYLTGDTSAGVFARIVRPPVDGRIVQGEQSVHVGDKVRVRLVSANPHNGFIDFERV